MLQQRLSCLEPVDIDWGTDSGPECPGGGSMETKLMMRIGMSRETSAESEPPTDTLITYVTSRWRPRAIVKASA